MGSQCPCPFLKAFSFQFQKLVEKPVLFGSWVTQYYRKQHLYSFSFFQTLWENELIVVIMIMQMCCLRGDVLCLMKKFKSLILVGTECSSQQTHFPQIWHKWIGDKQKQYQWGWAQLTAELGVFFKILSPLQVSGDFLFLHNWAPSSPTENPQILFKCLFPYIIELGIQKNSFSMLSKWHLTSQEKTVTGSFVLISTWAVQQLMYSTSSLL